MSDSAPQPPKDFPLWKLQAKTADLYAAIGRRQDDELCLRWHFDIECEGFDLGDDAYDREFEDFIEPHVLINDLELDERDWNELRADLSLREGDQYWAAVYVSGCHNFFPRLDLRFSRQTEAIFSVYADFDVDFESEGSGYRSSSGALRFDATFTGVRLSAEVIEPYSANPAGVLEIVSRFLDADTLHAPVATTNSFGWQYSLLRPRIE